MKKALIIGINYVADKSLFIDGCIEDALSIKQMLIQKLGYKESEIIVLRDDVSDVTQHPTGKNIFKALSDIIAESSKLDEFWFHYSGHGSYMTDYSGEELDGKDELIIPVDFKTNGIIHDDIFTPLEI